MNTLRSVLFLLLFLIGGAADALDTLGAGQALYQGQTLYSASGGYHLAADGSSIHLYRADGSIRWQTNAVSAGSYLAMQASDGNLVQYTPVTVPATAVWWTGATRPNTYLAVQVDGNLVIYDCCSPGVFYWNIGRDPRLYPTPKYVGDVVGRDQDSSLTGVLGHVGIWTGDTVVEVNKIVPNAAREIAFETFVAPGGYWGGAESYVPAQQIHYCWLTNCTGHDFTQWVWARDALSKRAFQVIAIGADYTMDFGYTPAMPAENYFPAQRGAYRCDTFVIDTFQYTGGTNHYYNAGLDPTWQDHLNTLYTMSVPTPRRVWDYIDQSM